MEEQQLIDICNKIYNKHRKALDLIYANRTDGRTQMADAIVSALEKLNDDGIIIHGQGAGVTRAKSFFRIPDCRNADFF